MFDCVCTSMNVIMRLCCSVSVGMPLFCLLALWLLFCVWFCFVFFFYVLCTCLVCDCFFVWLCLLFVVIVVVGVCVSVCFGFVCGCHFLFGGVRV